MERVRVRVRIYPLGPRFFLSASMSALLLLWCTDASATGATVSKAQRQKVARYKQYFDGYNGKLHKGVLPPKSAGGVGGVKAGLGFIGKLEGGVVRVSDAHGMKHVVARGTVGGGVAPGPIVMYHTGAVIGRKQAPGSDWRRLAPGLAGDVRGTVETSVGVGGGVSSSLFIGARPSVHARRHDSKWRPAGETQIYGAYGVSTSVTPLNLILEAGLTVNIPLRTYAGPLRKAVDNGLQAVGRAEKALRTGDISGVKATIQEMEGLRRQTRMEAHLAGGVKKPGPQ